MMRAKQSSILTLAERCRNILSSNWHGKLSTIQADSHGSKGKIYSSKVNYFVKKGRVFIWVPQDDPHDLNTFIDDRASFAVSSPHPGSLGKILRSMKKFPTRVALNGDVIRLSDKKIELAAESLQEALSAEQETIMGYSKAVSSILSSSNLDSTSRSKSLHELLDSNENYIVYKFLMSSCSYIDGQGGSHEVDLEDIETSKADPLSHLSMALIDGINKHEARRRALMLFCVTHMDTVAKDAFLLSVDRNGFDVLVKVLGPVTEDGTPEYQWKEFRFTLKEEARDIERFCQQLVEMEEEALNKVSSFSGIC